MHGLAWSHPRLGGVPKCMHGRAGHGALFLPSLPAAGAAANTAANTAAAAAAAAGGSQNNYSAVSTTAAGLGGELLLLSGATRSTRGDAHQGSIDVIEAEVVSEAAKASDVASAAAAGAAAPLPGAAYRGEEAPRGLRLRWSDAPEWSNVRMPEVRTAS